jgi:hypothetical protein
VPKRDELIGGKGELHKKELRNLYPSPNVIRITKSRRKRWAGNVACMGANWSEHKYWWESQKERDH